MTEQQNRVETPLVSKTREKEVVALIDESSSMNWEAAEGGGVDRWTLVTEAMPLLIAALEGQDSQAKAEQAGGSDEKGGVLMHGFSDGHNEHGDLNSSNFSRVWPQQPRGGTTHIMAAWEAALEEYMEEFGDADPTERPALMTLVITDGEAADADQFEKVLDSAKAGRYFAVAIVGHGDAHDRTLASYQGAAQRNPKHVAVMSFDSVTDPGELARELIHVAGLGE